MPTGDEILAWKKQIEEQELVERTECPECGWTLEKHPKTGVLHCPLCGKVYE